MVRLNVTSSDLNTSKTFPVPAGVWVELRNYFSMPLIGSQDLTFTTTRVSGGSVELFEANA
ncbi:hypothetical protein ASF72_18325 [Arthrobacter sp. Leaf141]|nr:hypothetical protein ASF72_18325 [Arthrobacter sp. Leaf141]